MVGVLDVKVGGSPIGFHGHVRVDGQMENLLAIVTDPAVAIIEGLDFEAETPVEVDGGAHIHNRENGLGHNTTRSTTLHHGAG